MKNMQKHPRLRLLVIAFLSVATFAGTAYASHSWGTYHWARTVSPFTLKLGDNVSAVWDASLAQASIDWTATSALDTNIVPGQSNPKNCRPVNGRVEICNSKYGNNGWLGIAQIWANGDHVTQGVVKLNDTYFATAKYNTPAWRQMVLCQEVGHTFGLDHQDEAFDNLNLGTCMDYTSDPTRDDGAGNNLHLNAHDGEELSLIYAHFDSFTSILSSKFFSAAPADIDTSDPGEWGKEVGGHGKSGNHSSYERNLGKGQKLFTFVIWAE